MSWDHLSFDHEVFIFSLSSVELTIEGQGGRPLQPHIIRLDSSRISFIGHTSRCSDRELGPKDF